MNPRYLKDVPDYFQEAIYQIEKSGCCDDEQPCMSHPTPYAINKCQPRHFNVTQIKNFFEGISIP